MLLYVFEISCVCCVVRVVFCVVWLVVLLGFRASYSCLLVSLVTCCVCAFLRASLYVLVVCVSFHYYTVLQSSVLGFFGFVRLVFLLCYACLFCALYLSSFCLFSLFFVVCLFFIFLLLFFFYCTVSPPTRSTLLPYAIPFRC